MGGPPPPPPPPSGISPSSTMSLNTRLTFALVMSGEGWAERKAATNESGCDIGSSVAARGFAKAAAMPALMCASATGGCAEADGRAKGEVWLVALR